MVRIVRRADGGAEVDRTGHAAGRGAYLHADVSCVEIARKKKAVERALKAVVSPELWAQLEP
jgi:predicted RNA-binding protein YlxR (DUF448 family)